MILDSGDPKVSLKDFMRNETRFRMVEKIDPERFRHLVAAAQAPGDAAFRRLQTTRGPDDSQSADRDGRAVEIRRAGLTGDAMDLRTNFLGFDLPHPFVPGASPLVDDLGTVKKLEDAGAPMIVMHSVFEEQILREQVDTFLGTESHVNSFAEAFICMQVLS